MLQWVVVKEKQTSELVFESMHLQLLFSLFSKRDVGMIHFISFLKV